MKGQLAGSGAGNIGKRKIAPIAPNIAMIAMDLKRSMSLLTSAFHPAWIAAAARRRRSARLKKRPTHF